MVDYFFCPKCGGATVEVEHGSYTAQRCTECGKEFSIVKLGGSE